MNTTPLSSPRIAVLIPCYNESAAIAGVVRDFRTALPTAKIYVFDNNSADGTATIARGAGAIVRHERRQGKGHVVRRMFADIEADIYVLADGDGTYDAAAAAAMVRELIENQLDMVVGVRRSEDAESTYRRGHQFGNRLFSRIVSILFENQFTDILSGYRVMSRRFVKSFPALAKGFEIETQLTVHALELSVPCAEYATAYYARAVGTESKLRTYRDGARILLAILLLFKETRPLTFFGLLGLFCAGLSAAFGMSVIIEYFETGLVPRFPTAILATGLALMAAISFTAGLTLDTVSRGQRELKRLYYLGLASGHGERA